MRHAFVITKPGTVSPDLARDIRELGCVEPVVGEVDLRGATAIELLKTETISQGAYLSLTQGRSSDYEFPSAAGVGCYLSHLAFCRQISLLPRRHLALVLEADCKIDVPTMRAALESMERGQTLSSEDPHVVLFGALPLMGCTRGASELCGAHASASRPVPGTDTVFKAVLPGAVVVLAHCCILTTSGASFILGALEGRPAEVQWDSALSVLSAIPTGASRGLLWWCPKGASQKMHMSSIQDVCIPCMMKGAGPFVLCVGVLLIALLVGVLIGYLRRS